MGEQPAVEKTPWFKFDLLDLQKKFCNEMLSKQAVILALPAIVGNDSLALRIQSEFADLKSTFCEAVKPPPGFSAGAVAVVRLSAEDTAPAGQEEVEMEEQEEEDRFPNPVPLVAQDLIQIDERIDRVVADLRRENRILNRKNERNIKRKKDLENIKSPMHKKLHNCYEAVKFLVEDVREEALQGAPSEWEQLGDLAVGYWELHQGSLNLHSIIKSVKDFAA